MYTKCFSCLGEIFFPDGATQTRCMCCNHINDRPKSQGEPLNRMKRAHELCAQGDFEAAATLYHRVLEENMEEHEARWGLMLCKYGVQYVHDPRTGRRYPTCRIVQFSSLSSEPEFRRACEYASAEVRAQYQADAEYIDSVQFEIRRLAEDKPPYDIFICYKETDERGMRTADSILAQDLYGQLQRMGFNIFFAPECIRPGDNYEAAIFHAIRTSQVMLALGTCPEHFEATWPKSEWSRFLERIDAGDRKLLVPLFRGMNAEQLPQEFLNRRLQAVDIGKFGAKDDIVFYLQKHLQRQAAPQQPYGAYPNQPWNGYAPYGYVPYGYNPYGQPGDITPPASAVQQPPSAPVISPELPQVPDPAHPWRAPADVSAVLSPELPPNPELRRSASGTNQAAANPSGRIARGADARDSGPQGISYPNPTLVDDSGTQRTAIPVNPPVQEPLPPAVKPEILTAATLELRAASGDNEARFRLGEMYYLGKDAAQDYARAAQLLTPVAEDVSAEGAALANRYLGLMYRDGLGVESVLEKAERCLETASDEGDMEAGRALEQLRAGLKEKSDELPPSLYDLLDNPLRYASALSGAIDRMTAVDPDELFRAAEQLFEQDSDEAEAKAVALCRRAAELGCVNAQYWLGDYYFIREGGHKDTGDFADEALRWASAAAESGHAEAMGLMGHLYGNGVGVEKNVDEEIRWYERAFEHGHAEIADCLGNLYRFSDERRDIQKSLEWYKKGAELGIAACSYAVADIYDEGDGVPQDYAAAMSWYIKAGSQGDEDAIVRVGEMYYRGEGVEQNFTAAINRFRSVPDSEKAQFFLGEMHYLGLGVKQDFAEAARLLTPVAGFEYGDHAPHANYYLGEMYRFGLGVEQDSEKAEEHLKKADRWDHPDAKRALDEMHAGTEDPAELLRMAQELLEKGDNEPTALSLLRRAAKLGNVEAMYQLGNRYFIYAGEDEDDGSFADEAYRWTREAAQNGHAEAMALMGHLYANGVGVEKNVDEEIRWYERAFENGDSEIAVCLANIYRFEDDMRDMEKAVEWYEKGAELDDAECAYLLAEMYDVGDEVPLDLDKAMHWYIRAGSLGDEYATARVGEMFYLGEGVEQNYTGALNWFRAVPGHHTAQFYLGEMHYLGRGVEQNFAEAARLFTDFLAQGFNKQTPQANYYLGTMYLTGQGVARDIEKAEEHLKAAAAYHHADAKRALEEMHAAPSFSSMVQDETGSIPTLAESAARVRDMMTPIDPAGMFAKGCELFDKSGNDQSNAEALSLLRRAAELGNVDAQYMLGDAYYRGKGVSGNNGEAFKWLRMAARRDHAEAQNDLGNMYLFGHGVKEDISACLEWQRKAAENGSADACASLGEFYSDKERAEYDPEEALRWYKLAAERGISNSAVRIGEMYYKGDGVEQNYTTAWSWFMQASDEDSRALFYLGEMYYLGNGADRNYSEAASWLLKAAAGRACQIITRTHFYLGEMYRDGLGVEQDYAKAIDHFTRSAEHTFPKDSEAMNALGEMYRDGLGVEADLSAAQQWFEKASERSFPACPAAMYNLGKLYFDRADYANALLWYRKAADKRSADAMNALSDMYYAGEHVPKNDSESVKFARMAADLGDAQGQNSLGFMYSNGYGVTMDRAKAISLYSLSALQGNAKAQNNLGNAYRLGKGVKQDYAESIRWYELAARQGHAQAQFRLGFMYENGQGVTQNYTEAAKWYRLAAEQGRADAQKTLGSFYLYGRGVRQSYDEAKKWYTLAAEQGDAGAQHSLGEFYSSLIDMPENYAEAAKWYRLAAEQEHAESLYQLALLYYDGSGVPKRRSEALALLRRAEAAGSSDAAAFLKAHLRLGRLW